MAGPHQERKSEWSLSWDLQSYEERNKCILESFRSDGGGITAVLGLPSLRGEALGNGCIGQRDIRHQAAM